ncbi:MAG: bifunctional glutamate N-acetyltransferase/amino-acid acetyltransferase ArgJ [Dehalococcoidales bacterium]|nr:MAG: bifunctional glutamate N-acetyltransferase/amino-acid acetyltransferase ArgJ [Dehalococcoidales bacterium]
METGKIHFIPGGTITSAKGFCSGATCAGIKKESQNSLDLGILFCEVPCVSAGLFTTIKTRSAPVILCQQRLQNGRTSALVVNSGCANAFTSEQGLADAAEMAALTADALGIPPEDVLVASTGVTGRPLPLNLIKTGLGNIALSTDGGHDLARAIMTTDTVPKEAAVTASFGDIEFTIGGVAKGSGMIHPDMATLLCFLATDAAVEPDYLKSALKKAADVSLNMISIDGDTSPSDTLTIMASGLAGNKLIATDSPEAATFQQALEQVCISLGKALARDGEGATKLIEITIEGAASITEARKAARAVASSSLVKAAVHGADPNWGRIVAAAGRSGIEMDGEKIDLCIGKESIVKGGRLCSFSMERVTEFLKQSEIKISLQLNLGTASATAWGCDLSEEYVTINSHYMT